MPFNFFQYLKTNTLSHILLTSRVRVFRFITIFYILKIKSLYFLHREIHVVHLRVEVLVEVVENNQRPHVVDEDEGDDNQRKDEENPECPD